MNALEQSTVAKLAETKNCPQATFFALDRHFDLGGGQVLEALAPFPGIAVRGETCGAVTGAMMALGLAFGTDTAEDEAAVFAAYAPARELCHRLEKMHGSLYCADLLEKHLGRSTSPRPRTSSSTEAQVALRPAPGSSLPQ